MEIVKRYRQKKIYTEKLKLKKKKKKKKLRLLSFK